jgi:hypothetical protein
LGVVEIDRDAGSDVDRNEGVGQRVVQLSSDFHPLLGRTAPILLLALSRLTNRALARGSA